MPGASMGGIVLEPGTLGDGLHETIGYKSGLAVSIAELCDLLSGTGYPDVLLENEENFVRLRSEEVQDLYYLALYKIGYTEKPFNGDRLGAFVYQKYAEHQAELDGIAGLMVEWLPKMLENAERAGTKKMDPRPLLEDAYSKYGRIGLRIALDRIEAMATADDLDPFSSNQHQSEWLDRLDLAELKSRSEQAPAHGAFFDQRFINFLANNGEKIGEMHWRRFEQMSAEFFHRAGYSVDIGTGGNDDGVDIRAWVEGADKSDAPTLIIQCKRQKEKVDKVTIKGLAADVTYNGAKYGVLITSAELSVGAREVVNVRGYPIKEVNADKVTEWLRILRAPGTGIVRV
jgi:restriction system protein